MAPDRLVFWVATDVDTEDAADWYLTPYATITGASSLARTDEADLVVETVGGGLRRQMQLTTNWAWRAPQASTVAAPARLAGGRAALRHELDHLRRLAATDLAMGFDPSPSERFEPGVASFADLALSSTPLRLPRVSISGTDLLTLLAQIKAGELDVIVEPVEVEVDTGRNYSVVLDRDALWISGVRCQSFDSVDGDVLWGAGVGMAAALRRKES